MPTKRELLHETVILARNNNEVPATHSQSEGNWTIVAVEPVLAALEWQRVAPANRADPGVNGAAYEWPGNHKIDAVLFVHGRAIAVMENRDTRVGARKSLLSPDIERKAGNPDNRARLSTCAWGVYSWHKEGGGFGWIPYVDGNLDPKCDSQLNFKDVVKIGDADRLAQLARPVLTGEVTQKSWLDAPIDHACAIEPRFDTLAVQRHFFDTLANELRLHYGKATPLELHNWEVTGNLPTLSKAYTELPGLLPEGWEIAYGMHHSEDYIQCLFYRGSRRHHKRSALKHNYDDVPERSFVDDFVRNKVLPRIEQHREASLRTSGPC